MPDTVKTVIEKYAAPALAKGDLVVFKWQDPLGAKGKKLTWCGVVNHPATNKRGAGIGKNKDKATHVRVCLLCNKGGKGTRGWGLKPNGKLVVPLKIVKKAPASTVNAIMRDYGEYLKEAKKPTCGAHMQSVDEWWKKAK